jgi:flagellar basal body-associated protein FliL
LGPHVEDEVLYLILLIIFLIQFLVVLGALIFVTFVARPEVPFSGDGEQGSTAPEGRDHLSPRPPEEKPPASGKNALRSSRKPTKQVMATRPSTLAVVVRPSG